MKSTTLFSRSIWSSAIVLSLLTASASVSADSFKKRRTTENFTAYADVISATPVYRNTRIREPRQECWTEEVRQIVGYDESIHRGTRQASSSGSHGGALVGGLIGGVIGNQLGRGHSRHSRAGATVAGAIIGGAIGSESQGRTSRHRRHYQETQVERHPVYETRPVERCRRVIESRYEQQLQHYDVTYRFRGRTFRTQVPNDPGRQIEIQVSVSPRVL